MKSKKSIWLILLLTLLFGGWGKVGHKIINKNSAAFLPGEMEFFKNWASFLAEHASDADYRKNQDPNESPKHYIDIDRYPEFVSYGAISQNFDSLVSIHGYNTVIRNGILPWTIITSVDSLTQQFKRKDWNKVKQTAADLGHYVGDSYMPLHLTENYNGQFTNQQGVHSRYESSMIGKFESLITYSPDTASYVSNVSNFVFSYIYYNYNYVDSVLSADRIATSIAGNNYSDVYYNELWRLTGKFTIKLFKSASDKLAGLIYTAWENAGKPMPKSTNVV
ncbi:MAG TPA: hypothetical protein ENI61_01315, partial [Ignavibacteria bacterium]|nr:hypothetical protein [Ignavibacteria bacterium]